MGRISPGRVLSKPLAALFGIEVYSKVRIAKISKQKEIVKIED